MKILWKNYLYESVLLEAYKPEDILRIYGKQLEDFIEKNWPTHDVEDTKKVMLNSIVAADPSADKKYLGQITKWLLEKRPEDLETQIKEYLNRFKKILDIYPGGEVGGISKELSKGKLNLEAFKNKVIELEKKFATNIENPDVKASKTSSNFKIIGQNETYVCFEVDRWLSEGDDEKHLCFSGDVDWCVKYKSYFDDYKPPYYYFMEKATGKEFALMHVGSSQLKNIRDEHLSYQDADKIKDIIYPILKKYSEGDNVVHFSGDFEVLMNIFGENTEAYRDLKMYNTTWFDYVRTGNLKRMKDLFSEYKFNIDIRHDDTRTALLQVCLDKTYDPIYSMDMLSRWLIDNGADIEARSESGETPIYNACQAKDVKIVEQLIAAGADVNDKTNQGTYPIEWGFHNAKILEMLLNAGASVDIPRDMLMTSIGNDNIESSALLLKAGVDPNKLDTWGRSAVSYSKQHNRKRFVEMFEHFNNTGEVVIPPEESNGPSDEELARELEGI